MTSTALVKQEISRFLTSPDPEVLCISGQWGIGKTFVWQSLLDASKEKSVVALERYAYVSLFGINSLDGFKSAIFENTEFLIDQDSNQQTDRAKRWFNRLKSESSKLKEVSTDIPYLGSALKNLGPLFFSTVRNQIICVDDLERAGKQLRPAEVLGLISFLREQRKCKIVLLLNSEKLGDSSRKEFDEYFEKVIDANLHFNPTALDSCAIALPNNDKISCALVKNFVALGVSNIRVIKKIERAARMVSPIIEKFGETVSHQTMHSIALFGWSKWQPTSAPPIEFIKKRNQYSSLSKDDKPSEHEVSWNALLDTYQFVFMDEYDLTVLAGIENGYFDPAKIDEQASKIEQQAKLKKQDDLFSEAWDRYHGSLDNNQDEVLDKLFDAFRKSIETISPTNLNATIKLFKDLGRETQSKEMIAIYVRERSENPKFWDLKNHAFGGDVSDPDVIGAFKERLQNSQSEIDLHKILEKLATDNGWHEEELAALARLSADQFYDIFKNHRGPHLVRMIARTLEFGRIAGASDSMQLIAQQARIALVRIAKESPINARRLKYHGVEI